jgi:transposase
MRDVMVMFQDEARFGRINSPHKCWVRGKRPYVYCQTVREYTYAYAAVCPFDGTMDSLVLPVVNSAAMNVFLEEVSKRHANKMIVMFLDQASWHKSKELNMPENIRLLPLPPYSPELNPAEHIWDELREKWFYNYTFDSMNAVEGRLVEGLCALEGNKELIKSITGFDWIISAI